MTRLRHAAITLLLAAPSFAVAADGMQHADAVPMSSLVIGAGGLITTALLALLAWSLKNNVEGFKIAVQQSLQESAKAKEKADAAEKELAVIRVEMAKGIRASDVDEIKRGLAAVTTGLNSLQSEVRVLMDAHHKKEA